MRYLSTKSLLYVLLMLSVSSASAVNLNNKVLHDAKSCIEIQLKQKLLNKTVTIEQAQNNLKNSMLHCFSYSPEATKLLKVNSNRIVSGAFPNNLDNSSITHDHPKVYGHKPAGASGNIFIATSQALSEAAHNATTNMRKVANSAN